MAHPAKLVSFISRRDMVRMKDDAPSIMNIIARPDKCVCRSATGVLLETDLTHELPEVCEC